MAAKQSCQMRLVAEPTGKRNLAEGIIRGQHEILGAHQPTPCNVCERCYAEAARERVGEMPDAQVRDCGEVL